MRNIFCIKDKWSTSLPHLQHAGRWLPVIGAEAGDVTGAVRPVFWEWEKLASVFRLPETLHLTELCDKHRPQWPQLNVLWSASRTALLLFITNYWIYRLQHQRTINEPRQDRYSHKSGTRFSAKVSPKLADFWLCDQLTDDANSVYCCAADVLTSTLSCVHHWLFLVKAEGWQKKRSCLRCFCH